MERVLIGFLLGFVVASLLIGGTWVVVEAVDRAEEAAAELQASLDAESELGESVYDDEPVVIPPARTERHRLDPDESESTSDESPNPTRATDTSGEFTGPPENHVIGVGGGGSEVELPTDVEIRDMEEIETEWEDGEGELPEDMDLYEAAASSNWRHRDHAAKNLDDYGSDPQVLDTLVRLLSDPEPEVRDSAAWSLGNIGYEAGSTVPHLLDMLRNSTGRLRERAAIALGNIGVPGNPAIPDLIEMLDHPDPEVQDTAAYSLGRVGEGSERAARALADALEAPSDKLRKEAAESLALIGEVGRVAIPKLLAIVRSGKGREWGEVVNALEALEADPDQFAAALAANLSHEDKSVRTRSLEMLAGLGSAASVATAEASRAVATAPSDELQQLLRMLAATGSEQTVDLTLAQRIERSRGGERDDLFHAASELGIQLPRVAALLEDAVRKAHADWYDTYAEQLRVIAADRDSAVLAIASRLSDPDWAVRSDAAEQLIEWHSEGVAAVPALIKALSDSRPDVRSDVADALGSIGPGAAAAIPALVEATRDEFGSVRVAAEDALVLIRGN